LALFSDIFLDLLLDLCRLFLGFAGVLVKVLEGGIGSFAFGGGSSCCRGRGGSWCRGCCRSWISSFFDLI
jgi:hypothetical protein